MGSSAFGLLPGNNAPMPTWGNLNPTGGNTGMFNSGTFGTMPNFGLFGGPGLSYPALNFGPNTGGASGGGIFGTTPGTGSGFGLLPGGQNYGPQTYNQLGKSYGQGFGQYLGDIFSQGLFNPQVAQQYINFMQPQISRGEANLLGAFGSEGARFGSPAQIGLEDYLSQVNLNEGEIFANMFQNAQQMQLGLLESVLPTVAHEKANQGGFLSSLSSLFGLAPKATSAIQNIGQSLGMGGGGGGGNSSIMDYAASVAPLAGEMSAAGAVGDFGASLGAFGAATAGADAAGSGLSAALPIILGLLG